MTYNDDERIDATKDVSDAAFKMKRTKTRAVMKTEALMEETKFGVMLDIMGAAESREDRLGVDLVTVLDISGSMDGEKLEKMKIAMQFLIKKLSPIDRLSVVTFADESKRLCPLLQITENSRQEIEKLVNDLVAYGNANISSGLEEGLKVLYERRFTNRRSVRIMLMSDGCQDKQFLDAAEIDFRDVPIFTFGFGADYDPKVLMAIAHNSDGGTFSDVQNQDKLHIAFSECLAGLLTVAIQDLKVTLTQVNSAIKHVSAGNYPQSRDDDVGSVIVFFGDLYQKELRKVIVDLLLPAVTSPQEGADVLKISYTYSTGEELIETKSIILTVNRIGTSKEAEREEVKIEERLPKKQGRPFALVSETSHALQRFAERGVRSFATPPRVDTYLEQAKSLDEDLNKLPHTVEEEVKSEELRIFATPRMDAYLKQAKSFDKNLKKPPPKLDTNVKQELTAYIQKAIKSLKFIENTLNTSRGIHALILSPLLRVSKDAIEPLPTVDEDIIKPMPSVVNDPIEPPNPMNPIKPSEPITTPRMDDLRQAKSFDKDLKKPPPKLDESVKQELVAYVQKAIQSLKFIENTFNRSRGMHALILSPLLQVAKDPIELFHVVDKDLIKPLPSLVNDPIEPQTPMNLVEPPTPMNPIKPLEPIISPRTDDLRQAKSFDKDPEKPPPKMDENVKQELVTYIQKAIQSLKTIKNTLNTSRGMHALILSPLLRIAKDPIEPLPTMDEDLIKSLPSVVNDPIEPPTPMNPIKQPETITTLKSFDKDPKKPPPKMDESVTQELVTYIQKAIQSLKTIEIALIKSR